MAEGEDLEGCVQFSVQQYQCISAASHRLQLRGCRLPKWDQLTRRKRGSFEWPCPGGWLGSLKFALASSSASSSGSGAVVDDDACKLYDRIQNLLQGSAVVIGSDSTLVFDHQGGGSFKPSLRCAPSSSSSAGAKQRGAAKPGRGRQARRPWYQLAREAEQRSRSVRGRNRHFQGVHFRGVVKKVLCKAEETRAVCDTSPPLWKTKGFRTELSRTLGFVARAMEREEEGSVDWAGLGMNHTSQPLLDTLGKNLELYVMKKLQAE